MVEDIARRRRLSFSTVYTVPLFTLNIYDDDDEEILLFCFFDVSCGILNSYDDERENVLTISGVQGRAKKM
jgi:hypothetical protein